MKKVALVLAENGRAGILGIELLDRLSSKRMNKVHLKFEFLISNDKLQ